MNIAPLRAFILASIVLIPAVSHPQVLEENFPYAAGSLLTANGYSAHSGAGANPLTVSAGSLTRAGYPSSGIGNSIIITGGSGSREDVNRTFPPMTTGSVFASFLVSVTTMSMAGDYFFHLAPGTVSTIFRGRVLARSDASGQISFGVSKSASADSLIQWTPFIYMTGQTYLIILKYTFNGATTSDDEVRLWVNPSSSTTEPVPNLVQSDNGSDISEVGSFVLRQGSAAYAVTLDGLRVSTSWNSVRLPLQLDNFAATVDGSGTTISWTTLTETNIYGFEVEKSPGSTGDFLGISGIIPGNGTTTLPHSYSFKDTSRAGVRFYRLREIDLDQSVYFSEPIQAGLTAVFEEAPSVFAVHQNYPNPFNPVTTIRYELAASGRTELIIYDLLGNEIATLIDGPQEAGSHSVTWHAGNAASGVYFSLLKSGTRREVRKMLLLR